MEIEYESILNKILSLWKFGEFIDEDFKMDILCESIRLHKKNYKPGGKSSEPVYYATLTKSLIVRDYNDILKIINRNKKIEEILS